MLALCQHNTLAYYAGIFDAGLDTSYHYKPFWHLVTDRELITQPVNIFNQDPKYMMPSDLYLYIGKYD